MRCPECEGLVEIPGESRISTPMFVATYSRCGLEFDWRLSYGKDFLRGATLAWQEHLAPGEGVWSYDLCAFYRRTFMEEPLPGVEQAGYVTFEHDQAWWVCRNCIDDFREEMGWVLEPPDERHAEPGAVTDGGTMSTIIVGQAPQGSSVMPLTLAIDPAADLARFRLPAAVAARLQSLLDRQDAGHALSADERAEAEGLVDVADLLTLLRLRAERGAA